MRVRILLLVFLSFYSMSNANNVTFKLDNENAEYVVEKIWLVGCKPGTKRPLYPRSLEKKKTLNIDMKTFNEYDFYIRISGEREQHFHLKQNTLELQDNDEDKEIHIKFHAKNCLILSYPKKSLSHILPAESIHDASKAKKSWLRYIFSYFYPGEQK